MKSGKETVMLHKRVMILNIKLQGAKNLANQSRKDVNGVF